MMEDKFEIQLNKFKNMILEVVRAQIKDEVPPEVVIYTLLRIASMLGLTLFSKDKTKELIHLALNDGARDGNEFLKNMKKKEKSWDMIFTQEN